jgi:hypothetical protein
MMSVGYYRWLESLGTLLILLLPTVGTIVVDEDVWRLVFVRRTSSLGDGEEVGNVKAEVMLC